jgi:hypothetical protein
LLERSHTQANGGERKKKGAHGETWFPPCQPISPVINEASRTRPMAPARFLRRRFRSHSPTLGECPRRIGVSPLASRGPPPHRGPQSSRVALSLSAGDAASPFWRESLSSLVRVSEPPPLAPSVGCLGGLGETQSVPSGVRCSPRGGVLSRPDAAKHRGSLRPCLGTTIASRRRATFHQALLGVRLRRRPSGAQVQRATRSEPTGRASSVIRNGL